MSESEDTEKDTFEHVLERAQCLPLDQYDPLVDNPTDHTPRLYDHGDETTLVVSDHESATKALAEEEWIAVPRGTGQ